jgi:hypothetical protein
MKELLAAKLAVMEKVRRVEKTRRMVSANGGYQYAGAEEIISEIRPAMVLNGLTIAPVRSELVLQDKLHLASNKAMTHSVLKVTFRLSHSSGQYEEIETFGEAADSMDKSINKCMTAALKYALLQTFLLQGAHDDPDDYASQEQIPEPAKNRLGWTEVKSKVNNLASRESSQYRELLDTYSRNISAANLSKLGKSVDEFMEMIAQEVNGLPEPEASKLKGVLAGKWLKRRIRQADKPGDMDLIAKQIESLNVPESWKESLRTYLNERRQTLQPAKNN